MAMLSLGHLKMFEKLLDKATSPLLLEPDWEAILQLCDAVKSLEVTPKHAIQSIRKKFRHENAHVILHALQCLESIVKNCGGLIHREVAQTDMIEALKELVKVGPKPIRAKVLELIQCWSYGLGQQYRIFTETFNQFKMENYRFPSLKESEAMFENEDIAPQWKDDKECFRCRQTFNAFVRKHHCRACGDIFCEKCSSRHCPLPKFGFDRDVRVCEFCYEKLTTGALNNSKLARTTAPCQKKCQVEIDEDESLQLALAISRSEADEKERQKKILTKKYATISAPVNNPDDIETNQSLEQEQQQTSDGLINTEKIDQFIILALEHLSNFKFRMLSDQQRHRNITTDTAVQSVFVILQYLHPELHRYMQHLEDQRGYYEILQDKLSQLKDAREALNALRSEHEEQKQQEALERERQRQIQLAQKLDWMRQKKQEYLEYQRQMHLQRLTQQEMEMNNRLEHQRQLTLAREQFSQTSHLSMIMPPLIALSQQSIDPNNHFQQSFHTPMQSLSIQCLPYPSNRNEGINSNYLNSTGQIPLINSTFSYLQPSQLVPMLHENQS